MSNVGNLVRDHFRIDLVENNHEMLVSEIDMALHHSANVVRSIFDQVVHPSQGHERGVDVDQVAATAQSLIAYLGHVGELVDALAKFNVQAPPRSFRPAGRNAD